MEVVDVAIVGGGPAGSTCAALCAAAGLRTVLLEREKFPREKVCGDCLNPACWPVLRRLDVADRLRTFPHRQIYAVDFIAIGGQQVHVDLPTGDDSETAIKRSLFDNLLLDRARELGAVVREETIVSAMRKSASGNWKIDVVNDVITARVAVGADGRNSTVARLCNLLPRPARERVALQSHINLPDDFGNRVVLQFLLEGYSGQAPVNERELNLCLIAKPRDIDALKVWAEKEFAIPADHPWRTVTPLTRDALPPAHDDLLLIGDAARVVEPFTGEGIYYALRSGELAADAIVKLIRGVDPQLLLREFAHAHAAMYHGRLWINRLARAAVLSPRVASMFVHVARAQPSLLRFLTGKIVAGRP